MKTISLSKGEVAIVDDCDFERLSKGTWHLHPNGYAKGRLEGSRDYMHRYILGLKPGQECDHINRIKLDNRRSNLRVCSRQENQRNLPNKYNKHGFPGVVYRKQNNKYISKIRVDNKRIHLGTFNTAKEAHDAFVKAKKLRDGEEI
jgi:hypothetical protein